MFRRGRMDLVVIDTLTEVASLSEYIETKEIVAFDIETTGLGKDAQVIGFSVCAEESIAFYVILSAWNPKTNSLDTLIPNSEVQNILKVLKSKQLVMHNGVFDCAIVENYFRIRLIESLVVDTMILAHLLNENRKVGLKDLGKEYFGEDAVDEAEEMKASVHRNGGKLTKASYEMYKADAYIMGKYGAKDALLTYKLFLELIPELHEQKLDEFFYEESMPLLRGPTYQLNTHGLKIDRDYLSRLKNELQISIVEADAFIEREIEPFVKDKYPGTTSKNKFNIGSNHQLSWLLYKVLELPFKSLTDAGSEMCNILGLQRPYTAHAREAFISACTRYKDKSIKGKKIKDFWTYVSVDKTELSKFAEKFEWITRFLERQKNLKLLTTYVEGIENRMYYGMIQPGFLQHGTTSGRYSSRDPNFQNLPRDDKRVKSLITARPGHTLVGADYSQLEPRVFAYFSNDVRLKAAFSGDTDFYSVIGIEVYQKTDCDPVKEGSERAFGVKYKDLRQKAKIIALASVYGATARQLSSTTGKSIEETQADIDAYFAYFPDVRKMMIESHEMAKRDGQVINLFGRPRRIPDARTIPRFGKVDHSNLPYEYRKLLNLAVNHRIQSTAASIVNRAAIAFFRECRRLNIKAPIVLQVHDSLVAECLEADAVLVAETMQKCMEKTTVLPGVPLEAIPKIGKTLADV